MYRYIGVLHYRLIDTTPLFVLPQDLGDDCPEAGGGRASGGGDIHSFRWRLEKVPKKKTQNGGWFVNRFLWIQLTVLTVRVVCSSFCFCCLLVSLFFFWARGGAGPA